MATKVVQQDGVEEVDAEVLAQSIQKIADAMDKAINSRLKFEAVVLLVSYSAKVGKRETQDVLLAASNLAKTYLKPVKKP